MAPRCAYALLVFAAGCLKSTQGDDTVDPTHVPMPSVALNPAAMPYDPNPLIQKLNAPMISLVESSVASNNLIAANDAAAPEAAPVDDTPEASPVSATKDAAASVELEALLDNPHLPMLLAVLMLSAVAMLACYCYRTRPATDDELSVLD